MAIWQKVGFDGFKSVFLELLRTGREVLSSWWEWELVAFEGRMIGS